MTVCIAAQGYQLSAAKREMYWPAPESKGETSPLTEIQFPVTRLRGVAQSAQQKTS
jgi:effector-binding domain-containing protein